MRSIAEAWTAASSNWALAPDPTSAAGLIGAAVLFQAMNLASPSSSRPPGFILLATYCVNEV
eukprot:13761919-Alexandrium_andersonii.AAC.1